MEPICYEAHDKICNILKQFSTPRIMFEVFHELPDNIEDIMSEIQYRFMADDIPIEVKCEPVDYIGIEPKFILYDCIITEYKCNTEVKECPLTGVLYISREEHKIMFILVSGDYKVNRREIDNMREGFIKYAKWYIRIPKRGGMT